ncbi:MAG: hypothetical protein ABH863_04940 [Candidatus Micrarchaeota archaeon]
MEIIGGRVTKAHAEKNADEVRQTSLSLNLVIKEMSLKGKHLVVKYSYEIDYQPKLAKMSFEGEIFMQDTEKAMKAMEEKWKKSKNIDQPIAEQMLNSVTYTGMAIGSLLAFSVGIPAPITVQKFKVDQKPAAS